MTIKKGDKVKILKGKDAGKLGKVLKVLIKADKVIVEGLNLHMKYTRPRRKGEKGSKIFVPAPIGRPNVMLVCPNCNKPTRAAHTYLENKKVRVCKKCKNTIN